MHETPGADTLTPDDFHRIREVFESALERPAHERRAFVEQACSGDTMLVAEVERMLAAEGGAHPLLDGRVHVPGPGRASQSHCSSCEATLEPSDRFCRGCGTPAGTLASESRFRAGAVFANRFRIVARLGHGGMGEVYRADDLELGQPVALKFLTAFRSDERARARLRTEVRLARQIAHPNVCRVYDIGEAHGDLYLSMEYVDGEDLAALLKRIGRLPIDKGIEIARKLCAGLAAAHAKGVLHRDFKPANIMIDGLGEVRIMDFGLAAVADQLEAKDVRSGTPAYMAPEQLAGKEATRQSDLYALGLVMYELLTGKAAFEARSIEEFLRLRQAMPATTPATLIPEIGPRVERAILQCLEPESKLRPTSALEVASSLPGGNPLADALAAGETPSPELVAAAGPTEGLSAGKAMAMLACVAAGLVSVLLVTPRVQMLTMLPLHNPPGTLEVRARDIIRSVGYVNPPAESASGFSEEEGYVNHFRVSLSGTTVSRLEQWRRILGISPSAMSFWYRESPAPLVVERSQSQFQRVTLTDPAPLLPGMISVVVDLEGRLLRLTAAPDTNAPVSNAGTAPDWLPFFAAAGLDMSRFTAVSPDAASSVINDVHQAWTGSFADRSDLPVRIAAASFRGRVTNFELSFPWTPQTRLMDPPREPYPLVVLILALALVMSVGLVARHNVTASRSDLRGAYRIGLCFGCGHMLIWIFGAHHPAIALSVEDFLRQLPMALTRAVMSALFYLAIEPWVRRYWPESMITWSRILAGRWRDPVVARDVLVGIVWAMISTLTQRLVTVLVMWSGGPPTPPSNIFSPIFGLEKLMGGWGIAADIPAHFLQGYGTAMEFFFCLFLFRLLLRRHWLSAAACFVFFTVLNGAGGVPIFGPAASLYVAMATLLTIVVAMKYGVLATGVFASIAMLTDGFLLTTNLGAWYGQSSLVGIVVVSVLALWAFRTSLGGRPLLAGGLSAP
jgi:serine/threonine-protein kinase